MRRGKALLTATRLIRPHAWRLDALLTAFHVCVGDLRPAAGGRQGLQTRSSAGACRAAADAQILEGNRGEAQETAALLMAALETAGASGGI